MSHRLRNICWEILSSFLCPLKAKSSPNHHTTYMHHPVPATFCRGRHFRQARIQVHCHRGNNQRKGRRKVEGTDWRTFSLSSARSEEYTNIKQCPFVCQPHPPSLTLSLLQSFSQLNRKVVFFWDHPLCGGRAKSQRQLWLTYFSYFHTMQHQSTLPKMTNL